MKTKRKAKPSIGASTPIEDQQGYFFSQLISVYPSVAITIVRITASDFFGEHDIDPLVREFCTNLASMIKRHNFKYPISLYALVEHDLLMHMNLIKI